MTTKNLPSPTPQVKLNLLESVALFPARTTSTLMENRGRLSSEAFPREERGNGKGGLVGSGGAPELAGRVLGVRDHQATDPRQRNAGAPGQPSGVDGLKGLGPTLLDTCKHVDISAELAKSGEICEGISGVEPLLAVKKVTPETCGHKILLHKHVGGCGARVGVKLTCGNRIRCVPCAKSAGKRLMATILPILKKIRSPRLLTLTLKNVPAGQLKEQCSKISKSWAKLRRHKFFKERCDGGVWTMEVVWGRGTGWHCHLHAVLSGQYIPQDQISKAWLKITGDSPVVDIRKADGVSVSKELCKYITKAWEVPEAQLQELEAVMRSKRRADTWGSCRGSKRTKPDLLCPGCGRKYRRNEWLSEIISEEEFHRRRIHGPLWRDFHVGWDLDREPAPDPDCPVFDAAG